jgi:LEM3 (ligand-effect modulator 3) family / CDC50 family
MVQFHTMYASYNTVVILIVIGVIIRATANNNTEFSIRFDDKCKTNSPCTFDLNVFEDVEGPFYVYIKFSNYHVNHRNVMRSFSAAQLRGEAVTIDKLETYCNKKLRNKDLNLTVLPFGSGTVDPEAPLNPCGILPALMPAGTHILIQIKLECRDTMIMVP